MIRRRGGKSLFASIVEPHGGESLIQAVDVVDLPGAELALQVTMAGRRDLVIVNASNARGEWQGEEVMADAELAILRSSGKSVVVNGAVRRGAFALKTEPFVDHRLLAVTRDESGCSLLLEGRFLPPEGATVVVDHAGQRTSGYRVASATPEGENSRLVLVGDPGFEFDAATGTSRFVFLPLTSYAGSHVVRMLPVGRK